MITANLITTVVVKDEIYNAIIPYFSTYFDYIKKYEEIGRIDKAILLNKWLLNIFMYYNYQEITKNPECQYKSIKCFLSELNKSLGISSKYLDVPLNQTETNELLGINAMSILDDINMYQLNQISK